ETELLLHVLKKNSNDFYNGVVGYSENLLNNAIKFAKNKDSTVSKQEIYFLNQIIYRTPTNSAVFMDALLARIIYFVRNQKYSMARSDMEYLKSFDPNYMTPQGLILVQTLTCISLYFMREMQDARINLHHLEELL
ncbi:hypothetical protein KR093_004308, partial [Drosophila rubida]